MAPACSHGMAHRSARLLRSALIAMLLLFALTPAFGRGQPALLSAQAVQVFDQGQLSLLRDPRSELTLEQVRSDALQSTFRRLTGNLGEGYAAGAWWLRLTLDNQTGQAHERWMEVMPAFLDDIRVHHVAPDGRVDIRLGGDTRPQSAKEEDYRGHLFKFELEPGVHQFFIRITTTSTVAAIVKLWQPDAFTRDHRRSYFGLGLYFSLILSVMLFNAMSWFVARRTEVIIYVGFLFFNALQWASVYGLTAEFVFPEQPLAANLTLKLAMPLGGALAVYFYILTLELRTHHRFAYWFSMVGIAGCAIGVVAALTGYYQPYANVLLIMALVSLFSVPWPAYRKWKTGEAASRLTALAYLLFTLLATVNILGTLSASPYSESTLHAGLAANLCHILLLHFALLQRLRQIEVAHAAAVERSVQAEREAQAERLHREEQDKLFAMVTHEIRTPLAVIDAATQSLIVLDPEPSVERAKRYERVRRSVDRLSAVLDLSLAQAGLDLGNWKPEMVQFDAQQLTRDVFRLGGLDASERLQTALDKNLPPVTGDLRTLRFALLNLIDNAVKYSPRGSPIRVRLRQQSSDGVSGVAWDVEDEGTGIPAGMEDRVFDKFFRVAESLGAEVKPGLGVGLYLCRHIAARHQGWVRAEAGRSRGACLTFWIPLSSQAGVQS